MAEFDYLARAELYSSRGANRARQTGYHRFDTAAEAIQYAVEQLSVELLHGAFLEVDEDRFDKVAIRALYDSEAFPLERGAHK